MTMEEIHILDQDILVACILLGLIAVVGLVGNGLMLRALFRYTALRTNFFVLLGSVAAADIVCLVIAVPMHIIYLSETTTPATDAWCKASKYIDAGSGFVASYHLVMLAVFRGIILTSRGRNPPTPLQTLVCVLVLWIIAFLAAIPFLLTVEQIQGYCHYTVDTNIEKEVWLLNSFSCFIPVGLIAAIYLLTHLVGQRYFEDSYSYKEKQISKLVTVIVGFYILLQMPYRVLDTHIMYKEIEAGRMDYPDEDMLESLYIARNYLLCLMIADKAARPVIYSQLAPGLSEAFDEVVNCTKCHRGHGHDRAGTSGGQKGNTRSGRHPSTSSRAPLTGESEGSNMSTHRDLDNELEVVQL